MTLKQIRTTYSNFDFETDQIENSKCPSWTKACTKIKNALKTICEKNNWQIETYSPNWYSCSLFVKTRNEGTKYQYAYISLPDPRNNSHWMDNILIRSADHNRDFTGGQNCHCKIEDLESAIDSIHKNGYIKNRSFGL